MTTQIKPRDWESLSAYLDNQLNPSDRIAIEARLKGDPELQTALKELRRTHLILRHAPRYRVPRTFTLTSAMAGNRRSSGIVSGAYPVLRLASALATLFFILVTFGSFSIKFISPAQSVVVRDQTENARPGAPFGMGGGGGGGAVEAPALAVMPTQEPAILEAESEMVQPAAKALVVTPLTPTQPTPTPEQMLAMAAPQESSAADSSMPTIGMQGSAAEVGITNQPAAHAAWSTLAILQITLAILALVTGLAALFLRRNSFR